MEDPNLSFDCLDEARTLSAYTIGFAAITINNHVEDAIPCGSGTLVKIGKVYGLATARHVIEAVRHKNALAVLRFPPRADTVQSFRVDAKRLEYLPLSGTDGPDGPDLGFIRFPIDVQETLAATNSFYPLDAPRPSMEGAYTGLGCLDLVLGVVEEWTTDIELTKSRRSKRFMLMMDAGFSSDAREHLGFDLATFRSAPNPDIAPPRSYAGVSGGGVWRIFYKLDGSETVVHRRLIGTAFYELNAGEGVTGIIHHGANSLEQGLVTAVRGHWPDAKRVE